MYGGCGAVLCQNCESKESTVHVTKIVNGQKTEFYLCEECAAGRSDLEFPDLELPLKGIIGGKMPLHQFFSGLLGKGALGDPGVVPRGTAELQCPACGLSYAQLGQIGCFGCDRCYEVFGDHLLPLLRRLHGNQKHIGKIPARAGSHAKIKKEIEGLRQELQKKVREEDFEEAVRLRDIIRGLEGRLSGGEGGD